MGCEAASSGFKVGLGRAGAPGALLAILVTLVLIATGLRPAPADGNVHTAPSAAAGDAALYAAVIDDVRGGASYYRATIEEQRQRNYPVRPFVAVRPPTLAVTMALFPELVGRGLLALLAVACLAAWGRRLRSLGVDRTCLAVSLLALASGVAPALAGPAHLFHEVWAGLLITLSLALRRPDRWGASVALGLLAACTRELAGGYLLVMAVLAWREGRRNEMLAWALALAALAGALVAHAGVVGELTDSGDLASQGWVRFGGWRFVLAAFRWNLMLFEAPMAFTALLAPAALLGLALWRDPLGDRVSLTVAGYTAAFCVVGRPENNYWGLLIAPLWPIGWALAPMALRAVGRSLLQLRPAAISLPPPTP